MWIIKYYKQLKFVSVSRPGSHASLDQAKSFFERVVGTKMSKYRWSSYLSQWKRGDKPNKLDLDFYGTILEECHVENYSLATHQFVQSCKPMSSSSFQCNSTLVKLEVREPPFFLSDSCIRWRAIRLKGKSLVRLQELWSLCKFYTNVCYVSVTSHSILVAHQLAKVLSTTFSRWTSCLTRWCHKRCNVPPQSP